MPAEHGLHDARGHPVAVHHAASRRLLLARAEEYGVSARGGVAGLGEGVGGGRGAMALCLRALFVAVAMSFGVRPLRLVRRWCGRPLRLVRWWCGRPLRGGSGSGGQEVVVGG